MQAVLEGVSFAIRDSFEVAKKLGLNITRSNICGGGSKSPLWRKLLSAILGIPLDVLQTEQGPGYGAAILAMVGCGLYPDVKSACDELVHVADTVEPDPELVKLYGERYEKFSRIYPALKGLFKELA